MRISVLMAGAAALWIQPANAVTFTISGTVTGIQGVVESCDKPVGFCAVETPYSGSFGFDVYDPVEVGGVYTFEHGVNSNAGVYSGTFRALGMGAFQGLNISYRQISVSGNIVGTRYTNASASAFTVRQISPPPVPEPTTWAMMLLGFAAIGFGLRRRSRPAAAFPRAGHQT